MRWWANFFFHDKWGFGILLLVSLMAFVHLNPGVLRDSLVQLAQESSPVVGQIVAIVIMCYGVRLVIFGKK